MMGTALDPQRRPTPRSEGIEVSDAVEEVFRRAFALDPRERQADAGAFWNELSAALGIARDARPISSIPPRDPRSDGAAIPRVETIEAFVSVRSVAPVPASREAETLASDAFSGSTAALTPAIPDLALEAAPASGQKRVRPRRTSSGSRAYSSSARDELEFDSQSDLVAARDIALDLPLHEERALSRASLTPPRSGSGLPGGVLAGALALEASSADASSPSRRSGTDWRASGRGLPEPADNSQHPLPAPQPGPVVTPLPKPGAAPAASRASSDNLGLRAVPSAREPSLARRLLPGVILLLLSIIVTLADQAYAASSGEVFALGPLRAGWIGAGLMASGIGLIIYKLLPRS
jgi:serine/threonine-protein kinase